MVLESFAHEIIITISYYSFSEGKYDTLYPCYFGSVITSPLILVIFIKFIRAWEACMVSYIFVTLLSTSLTAQLMLGFNWSLQL